MKFPHESLIAWQEHGKFSKQIQLRISSSDPEKNWRFILHEFLLRTSKFHSTPHPPLTCSFLRGSQKRSWASAWGPASHGCQTPGIGSSQPWAEPVLVMALDPDVARKKGSPGSRRPHYARHHGQRTIAWQGQQPGSQQSVREGRRWIEKRDQTLKPKGRPWMTEEREHDSKKLVYRGICYSSLCFLQGKRAQVKKFKFRKSEKDIIWLPIL